MFFCISTNGPTKTSFFNTQPYKFTGSVTLTSSADHFTSNHVNTYVKLDNTSLKITAVGSATSATATIFGTLQKSLIENAFREKLNSNSFIFLQCTQRIKIILRIRFNQNLDFQYFLQ